MNALTERQRIIGANLTELRRRIAVAAEQCGRHVDDIHILAVSKFRPATDVEAAAVCGLRDFGENYVSEAITKMTECTQRSLCWHCIGPLQANKTKNVAESFSWLHTLDREKIATRLSSQRPSDLTPLNVCIQVRLGTSGPRSGVDPEAVLPLARMVSSLPGLRLRGLMTLPGLEDNPAVVFSRLRRCLEETREALGIPLDTLSMGMTDDLEAAVKEGSSLLRIGTALFGPRPSVKG